MIAFQALGPGCGVLPVRSPTIPPATETNVYLLGGAVLVDPGCDDSAEQDRLIEAARAAGAQAILLSHHHVDHVVAAPALREALRLPIWAHPATAALLSFEVDAEVGEGPLPLAGEASAWQLLHTPGHAPGHLCAFAPASGQLFCGDMVSTLGSIFVGGDHGDMHDYLTQLIRLRDLQPHNLYPSHGPPDPDGVGRLSAYIQHRLAREAQVLTALQARGPSTAAELLPTAYKGTPSALIHFAELACAAHLIKLVKDGQAQHNPTDGRFAAR